MQACRPDILGRINWGVATAAYQIEGAHARAGKNPSIWDTFVNLPGKIRGGATGDVADDFYSRFKADFALMKEMGVTMHR
jgi:beta-glucosidase